MNPVHGVPWFKVILNLLWIFGLSLLWAVFLYDRFTGRWSKTGGRKPARFAALGQPYRAGLVLLACGILGSSLAGAFSKKPNIIRVRDRAIIPLQSFEGQSQIKRGVLVFSENGWIRSDRIQFDKGRYRIRINSLGPPVLGESARLQVFVGIYPVADFFAPPQYEDRFFDYDSRRSERNRLRIDYVNDYFYPPEKINRNGFIRDVEIIRLPDEGPSPGKR